jgi:hypothetical protein
MAAHQRAGDQAHADLVLSEPITGETAYGFKLSLIPPKQNSMMTLAASSVMGAAIAFSLSTTPQAAPSLCRPTQSYTFGRQSESPVRLGCSIGSSIA